MLERIERLNKHVTTLQGLLEDSISERCSLLKDFRDTMLTGILRNVDTYDEFHRNTFTGVQALLTFYRLYQDGAFGFRSAIATAHAVYCSSGCCC